MGVYSGASNSSLHDPDFPAAKANLAKPLEQGVLVIVKTMGMEQIRSLLEKLEINSICYSCICLVEKMKEIWRIEYHKK